MAKKKSLLIAGAVAGVVSLASLTSFSMAMAASNNGSTIVDRIATEFNLNKEDVQKVFKSFHEEKQAERKVKLEERLTQAVTDGKITEDQKAKILTKLTEFQEYVDSLADKTEEERKEAIKSKITEMEKWAAENDVPTRYLRPFGKHREWML